MAKLRKRNHTAIASADPCTATAERLAEMAAIEERRAARAAFNGRWYVVHTGPGQEGIAERDLWRQRFVTFYPQIRVRTTRKLPNRDLRRIEWVKRPLFSRYIFVGLEEGQGLYLVNEAAGVSTVVYFDGVPLVVPPPVMAELLTRADEAGLAGTEDRVSRRPQFAAGQMARMADCSPLAGLIAEISLDNGNEVMLWVELLGGRRQITVAPEAVGEILT